MGTIGKIADIIGWGGGKTARPDIRYGNYISNADPIIKAFGRDIFLSDIVKTAVHRIAEAVSKCYMQSVVVKTKPFRQIEIAADEINALFESRVNPLMPLKDFLYKVAYLTVKNMNCFIYPAYDEIPIAGGGLVRRKYTGFYPLEPTEVRIYYNDGEMRIALTAKNGTVFDIPYADIIHIRYQYGENPFLGGDASGRRDVRALLKNLQIMHVVKENIPKTIEASLALKGILSMKTVADADAKTVTREEFENHLFTSRYGVVATDYESEFTPVNVNATDLPPNIMTFLTQEILSPFGVSLPILNGKFNDEEYAAFFQTAPEGIIYSIAQGFTAALFTPKELAYGHKIKVYDRLVQNLSFKLRKEIVEMANPSALLDRDEQRELLGYEPDGQPTRVSLNFVNIGIADAYQLSTIKDKKESTNGQDTK